jgi:glycosyltransferase involved in cell wall biosynthesis
LLCNINVRLTEIMPPFLSVVVCSYNREKYIADAINSLLNQTLAPELYEIIIIDNNSKDKTGAIALELLKQHKQTHQIHYFKETNQGLCFARNRGIIEAKGKFICYMDDDGIADPNFLKVQCEFLQSHADVIGLGGKIIPRYVHGKPKWIDTILEGLVSKVDYGDNNFQYTGKRYPVGCNMTYRKDILEAIGMFDTSIGQVGDNLVRGDETELFERIKKLNKPVYYLGNSRVEHVIEQDRLTRTHIKKMSEGVGIGLRQASNRSSIFGKCKIRMVLVAKFFAALLFALYYTLTAQFSKAKAWIIFRLDVHRGFLKS